MRRHNAPKSRTAPRLLAAHRMPRDLDDELLRIARDFLVTTGVERFTCDDLARFIRETRPAVRLGHPYLHDSIEALADSLASEELLARDGATFRLTDRARAHLDREPELLIEPPASTLVDKVGT